MIKLLPQIILCGIASILLAIFGFWYLAIPFTLMGVAGYYMSKLWEGMEKELCSFCKKELRMEYHEGKTMYNENEEWAHKKCVPKEKLKEWKKTE